MSSSADAATTTADAARPPDQHSMRRFWCRREKRQQRQQGLGRQLILPEGVSVPVQIASFGERLTAASLDFVLLHVIFLVLLLGLQRIDTHLKISGNVTFIVIVLSYFLLRVGWFTLMELRLQGVTLGKMLLGLRVIDRRGGRLTAGAVVARNLTRELEMFLPMQMAIGGLVGESPEITVTALGWTMLFALLPLFNRDRMRLGDLIGGTWVISDPKPDYRADLASTAPRRRAGARFRFTPQQLEHYGIYELQMLEKVLRNDGPKQLELQIQVAQKIAERIGYDDPELRFKAGLFLQEFYIAQRGRLEQLMRHGERREHKRGRGHPVGPAEPPVS